MNKIILAFLALILSIGTIFAQEVEQNELSGFSSQEIVKQNYLSFGWANLGMHFSPTNRIILI